MKTVKCIVMLDEDGDMVEFFPEEMVIDYLFELLRIQCPKGKLHYAELLIKEEVRG